ncbi:MAG: sulfatase-modifying factor protein [Rhodothermaeota bacterium MED-G12]|jgi:sulfatase modifying factor 1|nr:MAG: sulfatase-modifying factor protein [Rhodothermaeota bacterium MED-G12]|tara:strand:+ start:63 stop:1073 length:1011 start_codon:yes stop_codon:yes gene_type:complete
MNILNINKIALIVSTLLFLNIINCSNHDVNLNSNLSGYNGCCYTPDGKKITSENEFKSWLDENKMNYKIPSEMSLILGGETWIGSESGLANEKPVFQTKVQPFLMDKKMVTVADFRTFIEKTGYVTEAEKFGDGVVFDFEQSNWVLVPNATWEYPQGPSGEKAYDNHPVTMLSYNDVVEYLSWVGKRLPTEIEWEHAARGISLRDNPYSWGQELLQNDTTYMANTWNGVFPIMNTIDDGYLTTSPVGTFGTNQFDLSDMGGNVWEWTSDWYRSYEEYNQPYTINPGSQKVLRGGSFLCHTSYCHGYRVSARSYTPIDNSMFHLGFRGVKSVDNILD